MNSMSDLYLQYEDCLRVQKGVIERNRRRLRRAMDRSDMTEVQRLNNVLRVLYEERSELEERAKGLRDYLQQ